MKVDLSLDGPVAVLTLSNPSKGNALTPAMMAAGAERVREAEAAGARALVLCGDGGRNFCSGYDLSALSDVKAAAAKPIPELIGLLLALEAFPYPLLAALNGHAIGGGALLALHSDLRWGQRGSRFGIPAARIGMMYPLDGLRRIEAVLGLSRAAEVLLLAEVVPVESMEHWGLFQALLPAEELMDGVMRAAHRIAGHAPLASRGLRAALRAAGRQDAELEALHRRWMLRCVESTDLIEGISAVQERREPQFEGR